MIKYINVNDIEDIITAKIDIDKINGGEKSNLNDFFETYCMIDNMYSNDKLNIFFKIFKFGKNIYVFYIDESGKLFDKFSETLKRIDYNFDKLNFNEIIDEKIFSENYEYFIINNKYVKL